MRLACAPSGQALTGWRMFVELRQRVGDGVPGGILSDEDMPKGPRSRIVVEHAGVEHQEISSFHRNRERRAAGRTKRAPVRRRFPE